MIKETGRLETDSISELDFVKKMKEDIQTLYRVAEHDNRSLSYKAMIIINSFRIQYMMEQQKSWMNSSCIVKTAFCEYNPHIYEFDCSLSLKNFVLISQPIKFE